jgi:hypothetical protein
MKLNKGRTVRLQFFLRSDELAAIEDFRYRARMPSRAAAVRENARHNQTDPLPTIFAIVVVSTEDPDGHQPPPS